jgi:high-affinity iron transporter
LAALTHRLGALVVLLVLSLCLTATVHAAGSAEQDLRSANATVQKALGAAQGGDLSTARQLYNDYENAWFDIEDGVRSASRDAYVAIEKDMTGVSVALSATPPDQSQVVVALQTLNADQQQFIAAQQSPPTQPTAEPQGQPASIATLMTILSEARTALAANDYQTATARLQSFQTNWLDVEGEVKTRSADDYRQTENDMALATSLSNQQSPQALTVVDRMSARLEPYTEAQQFGVFDAAIILLREGLEALLVIAALSAVLKRSATPSGQHWLWAGALAGLGLSIALGFGIQAFFSSIINPSNRELLEGVIGLFAAVMLIYVSYWLHSKASLGGWQNYINAQTRDALHGGRLAGIAVLAFLAVFREGAETALFYLGMVSNISTRDLLVGLAIGFGGLLILGFLMVVVGVHIPMRPFFAVASVLVFYLCFKFVGTGIHALQVSGYLPSGSSPYLPNVDAVGLYPTWPTTIAQLLLLGAAAWVLLRGRLNRSARGIALGGVGAGVVLLGACTLLEPSLNPIAPATTAAPLATAPAAVQATATLGAPTTGLAANIPPAPALTSGRREATLVSGPRFQLEVAATAVANNNLPAARAAMDAYDAQWNGIEVYVNFRSRDLYGDIETHWQADINKALADPSVSNSQILPMLQSMIARYDDAIRLSDTGAPLSPMFDELATLRTVRAPLRSVSPALKAGDMARASAAYAEFKSRYPLATPLISSRASDALPSITDALAQADSAMRNPTADSAASVDALVNAYNAAVNTLNTAARDAGYQS